MHSLEKLKENSVWYDANLDSLLPKYRGRYIAISGGRVLGDYGDFDEGVDATLAEGYAPGTFMVHLCVPREEELPRVYLSGCADFSGVMDVISRGDVLLTNKGTTEFAFRIPSEGKSPL